MRKKRTLFLLTGAAHVVFASQPTIAQNAVMSLGELSPGFGSQAFAISSNGSVVVGESGLPTGSHAFRWTQSGMVDIHGGDFSSKNFTAAYGVNADGSVVVGSVNDSTFEQRAFRWTQSSGMVNIHGGDFASSGWSVASAVNADGSVVVGWGEVGSQNQAFRWTATTGMVNIHGGDFSSGIFSSAYGVNADGSVVVGEADSGVGQQAFRWTQATGMKNIHGGDFSAGNFSTAFAVNADGTVVVGQANNGTRSHAFRWTQTTGMVDIHGGDFTSDKISRANAVSADGNVVVGNVIKGSVPFTNWAFRWTPTTGMRDLNILLASAGVNMSGISLKDAKGVSGNGQFIVGWGDFSGSPLAYLVRYDDSGSIPIAGLTTPDALVQSFNSLLATRAAALIQQQGFAAPLLGSNTPMGLGNEVGMYASAGSAAAGGNARYSFGNGFTVLGGIAYAREDYANANLKNSVVGAGALRYVWDGPWWRPFVEGGGWYTPNADLTFYRTYANGAGTATGVGNTRGDLSYYYGRAGLLIAKNQQSQFVITGEIGRQELQTNAYLEQDGAQNPFYAYVSAGTDAMNVTKARLSFSHAFDTKFDTTLWGAWAYGFNRSSSVTSTMFGVGTITPAALANLSWFEYGARIGYHLTQSMTLDVFANGVTGEGVINTKVHVGGGLRASF